MFQKPDPPEPTFPKPDVPPVPLLKKPDDGVVVEFPKPGVPAISIGMLIGPRLPDTSMPNGIAGIVIGGVVRGPMGPPTSIPNGIAGSE
ncbi:Uncharacterised protein [Mycobacterium tuberculosis]|nr:Uncharacterised protein [Mycobacterium tuberculosis]CMP35078.1 Uncharacterised protein [Mycobacterium tuberculosis]